MSLPKKPPKKFLKFSGIAFQMLAIIGLGTFWGSHLDQKYATETPFYTLIFSLVSVFVALAITIRQVIHKPKSANEDKS
ncbi:MAG: AtpZ/AtpI family protein [Flavobacteriaceae bacterium]|jgi:F0F1-type ATP synthase assembly protein I|nr:AtpZ/AtpI family protein [Flavobacteriaceae bacterium]MDG2314690.1 AtpZ/AtpI family protein [Flavobacteriaceae bacterium]